ncbi:AI-2E family transporter [Pedobacter sp. GSP4]|uniref:AI-2E family transporter n=1 Tax=Pedobacter sp. GSP4 TaxID=3453716 RepID=UPI003EEE4681
MNILQRNVYLLLIVSISLTLLYFGSTFLIPLCLAAIFSMVFIRLCNWLECKGIPRGWAALLCLVLFVFCISIIAGLLYWQLGSLSENLDEMKRRLGEMLNQFKGWIDEKIGVDEKKQAELIKESSGATGSLLAGFASGLVSVGVNIILVLVYMYLSLYYRGHIKLFILKVVHIENREATSLIIHESGKVAQHYLSGMAAMIGALWLLYGIGFSIVGVESAIFFAVLCGILEIVPFIGNLTGTGITILAVVAQGGDGKMIIGVLIVYTLVQFLQTYILEPLIVGEQVNINPFFTILSIVFGELVWGVAGMILAIPIMGILKIICDRVPPFQPVGFLIGLKQTKIRKAYLFGRKK